jgi:glycosyltransferase involved in cell wall biosynthesis
MEETMDSRVVYTFGETLGGSGIGRIANHAVAGLHQAGFLSSAIAIRSTAPDIPANKVTAVPFGRLLNKCPNYYLKDSSFDFLASRYLPESFDALHGWNNMCLRCLRRAKECGAVTVVERASTHPSVQRRLVEEEYERFNVNRSLSSDRTVRRMNRELQETDAVFVPSQFVYDSFLDEGFDNSDLRLIPFGVDTEMFHPSRRENYQRDKGKFRAVFVGQVSLRKGIQYLLPAWTRADVDGELIVAGQVTDPAEDIVDEYRDDPSIKFEGWVEDIPQLYREVDAFVFPSIEEGSALVSYEAMASGLPSVVTPNVGSLVEDDEHGIVVEPREIDAITDAIETLAADPEVRERYGQTAREKAEDYTWKRYEDRVAEVYFELLSN